MPYDTSISRCLIGWLSRVADSVVGGGTPRRDLPRFTVLGSGLPHSPTRLSYQRCLRTGTGLPGKDNTLTCYSAGYRNSLYRPHTHSDCLHDLPQKKGKNQALQKGMRICPNREGGSAKVTYHPTSIPRQYTTIAESAQAPSCHLAVLEALG